MPRSGFPWREAPSDGAQRLPLAAERLPASPKGELFPPLSFARVVECLQ